MTLFRSPEVAAVDAVFGRRIIVIAAALGHRARDAHRQHVVDQRHVEHREQAAAVVIADLALDAPLEPAEIGLRSEENTSELKSLMRTSYAVFCLKKKHTTRNTART